jgi:hypothetical protein
MSVQRKTTFFVVAVLVAGGVYLYFHCPSSVTDKDFIVIADFTNTTADRVFDDTLRRIWQCIMGEPQPPNSREYLTIVTSL